MLFIHFLTLCSEYDYVLFDMGPSLGAINRSILLASDYFITPTGEEEIERVLLLCRQYKIPFYIMGNGSNLLVGDKGYRGSCASNIQKNEWCGNKW